MRAPAPSLFAGLRFLAALFVGTLGSLWAADEAARFSQWLSATEQKEIGLEKLSSDQIAVLDALVRRDLASGGPRSATTDFSKRLTPAERRNAGFEVLSAEQAARLDVMVGRHAGAKLARELLSPPVYLSKARIVEPVTKKKEREIHGSFSLSMGWGSGGYSEKTGAMEFHVDDPEGRYRISVGYSESHIKGPAGAGYYVSPGYVPGLGPAYGNEFGPRYRPDFGP